jgi:hypothetical protein
MTYRSALRAGASLALIALAALPAPSATLPQDFTGSSAPDDVVQPEWPARVDLVRLIGGWQTSFGHIQFEKLDGDKAIGRIFLDGKWSNLAIGWTAGRGLVATVTDAASPITFVVRMSSDGKRFEARHLDGTAIGGRETWAATPIEMVTLDRSMWVGKWRTPHGELSLAAEGYHLVGTLTTPAGTGQVPASRQVALIPGGTVSEPATGQLTGAWRGVNGTSGAGSFRLEIGRNGEQFYARMTRDVMGAMREETFEGQRVRRSAPPPAPASRRPNEDTACIKANADKIRAGDLLVERHFDRTASGAADGKARYINSLMAVSPNWAPRAVNPDTLAMRIEEADGSGITTESFYHMSGEQLYQTRELRCARAGFLFGHIDVPHRPYKKAVLLVDGKRAAEWDISGEVPAGPYAERAADPAPATPPEPEPEPGPEPVPGPSLPGHVRMLNANWCTEVGMLRVRVQQNAATAAMFSDQGNMTQYLMDLRPSADGLRLDGTWLRAVPNAVREPVSMTVAGDGRTMTVTLGGSGTIHGRSTLKGVLVNAESQPAPDACVAYARNPGVPAAEPEPQPQPQPGPAPQPAPQPGPSQPQPSAGFKPLMKYDVRVDRVAIARDQPRIDVFVTLRNATQGPLYATSGALTVRLEDSDGVGKVNGQILRPTPESRAHFASTPVIEPGGELRAKYSFHPDPDATPARVIVIEGEKRAEFGAGAGIP